MDLTRFIKNDGSAVPGDAEKVETTEDKDEMIVSYLDIPLHKLTPGMRQFVAIKKKHMDCVILFRMGDFYETFYDDAETVARELEIVLTARGVGEKRAPLAGVPYHALEPNLAKLVKKGYKVAIVEQLEDPKKSKGLVKRGVVRIVSPGTVMESGLLEEKSNNYIMSVHVHGDVLCFALCDISTGEFLAAESTTKNLANTLARFNPVECVVPVSLAVNKEIFGQLKEQNVFVNPYDDRFFRREHAVRVLTEHFKTKGVEGFGLQGFMVNAAGALLSYVIETQKTNLSYINKVKIENVASSMMIDASTIRNLELLKNMHDNSRGTLLSVIDKTTSSMGSRLLRRWIKEPLLNVGAIDARLDAVEWLKNETIKRNELIVLLQIQDVERLIGRINYGNANARDLLALKKSLERVPLIKDLLSEVVSEELVKVQEMPDVSFIVHLVEKGIVDEPAVTLREGDMIKRGYHGELDKLHEIKRNSKIIIKNMEEEEKKKTGIRTLRIRFNNVFGYYIEVSKSYLSKVPTHYVRKQTTANGERYFTPELKEQEELILNAEEKINTLEYELFQKIISEIANKTEDVQEVSSAIAHLDVFLSFATCAALYNYVRPVVDEGHEISLVGSRHPVVEQMEDNFVSNDITIKKNETMIITGPNMSGKSVTMKQVALVVLLAQMGSFVPCSSAGIGVVDRIFTRVGASDDLSTGQSTFMVEMNETANILHNATSRSLIILDEIGRGTSTYDGMSIAWSVAEYISHHVKAKTLFATHYHILNKLADTHEAIVNYNVAVKEDGHEIVFLHKILEGSTDKSYGVHVARLAGMPDEVIKRAMDVQKKLEEDKIVEKVH